ncbi:MAG: hypothetical protein J0M04_15885 [Verrucomicrobia bacterium]|nr:hypothetical protein [Verrucomicrobiota bacterium]
MKTKAIARIAGILVCCSMAASAQSLDAVFYNVNPTVSVTGSFNGGGSYTTLNSGVMNFDYADAFCVDPNQTIHSGETVHYTIQPTSALPNSASIAKVVGGYLASGQTALDAAGAQWAIWEIMGDGVSSPSFSSGSVRIQNSLSSNVATRGLQYLNNLSSLPTANIQFATSPTRQDMVFMVPEVSGAVLGALGGLALLLRRRR